MHLDLSFIVRIGDNFGFQLHQRIAFPSRRQSAKDLFSEKKKKKYESRVVNRAVHQGVFGSTLWRVGR